MSTLLFLFYVCLNFSLYPKTMVATEINYDADVVVCQDFNGNEYQFEGVEDWCEGDVVSAIMWGKETASIRDDEIVMARYGGQAK